MPTFEALRVSLARVPYSQGFFEEQEPTQDRQVFFNEMLGVRRDFPHYKRRVTYVPIVTDPDFIAGVFGKEIYEKKRVGPDEWFDVTEDVNWPLAYVFFENTSDSQIAVVQYNNRVGSPRRILESLFKNYSTESRFRAFEPRVEYITSKDEFWATIKQYRGKITSINFTFLPPNALGAGEAVDRLVDAAYNEANSEETEVRLRNKDGKTRAEGELVETSVDRASRGGGEIKVKSGKKTVYSSSKHRRTQDVDDEEIPEPSAKEEIIKLGKNLLKTLW